MIYPQKLSSKEGSFILKSLAILSILIAITLIIINKLTTPNIPWAALANAGIIYSWIVVMYCINKNTNIAGHVLVQTLAISLLTVYIDYKLGFKMWSINIAMPIIIMIANATMLFLTIWSYKKYFRYAIYQVIIVLFSLIPIVFIFRNMINNFILNVIAASISVLNLLVTLALCFKDVKDAIVRKFHM